MWVKLDDGSPDHPKFAQVGAQLGRDGIHVAFGFWARGNCYANKHLTDGFLPDIVVKTWSGRASKIAAALVAARLWEKAPGGYLIHDYHRYNPRADEIVARREKDRIRKENDRRSKLGLAPLAAGNPLGIHTESERIPRGQGADGAVESARNPELRAPAGADTVPVPSRPVPSEESSTSCRRVCEAPAPAGATAPATHTDDITDDDLPPDVQERATAPEPPTPTPPLRGRRPPLAMRGRVDVAWPGRPAVPGMLHAELRELLGGPEDDADAKLRAWYPTVAAQRDGKPIGDDAFRFWRARFREWVGTTVTVVAPVRDKQAERKAAETAFLNRRRSQV